MIYSLHYYNVDAVILIDNLLGHTHNGNMVDVVARNFAQSETIRVMQMAAYFVDDVQGVLAQMR